MHLCRHLLPAHKKGTRCLHKKKSIAFIFLFRKRGRDAISKEKKKKATFLGSQINSIRANSKLVT